jgi:mannose-1-phosphate guanylyltransferase
VEFPEGSCRVAQIPSPSSGSGKPDLETAKEFVTAKRFYWNSGMFFWRADVSIPPTYLPATADLLATLPPERAAASAQAQGIYPQAESISVITRSSEKAQNVVGLAADDFFG